MKNDDLEIYFRGEGPSELSDFEVSGDDDTSSDYDPKLEKYVKSAGIVRNYDITVDQFMDVENIVFEELKSKRLSHLNGKPMEL
ncbi:hypothetical protein AYI68_g93 [Smittium mucronatum]|uniref:Uncharacterized protein n=1 Tax=Smittium mucronatum TaxID=133383 RepID=A0A1R0H949_9FUNG|nr:hypothetical protein AYI68_g93 [Smittium mucronatum]